MEQYYNYLNDLRDSDTLNELHSMQFNMLEEALEKSNMAESKTVLAHIMGMK